MEDDPYAELRAQYRASLPARLARLERLCAEHGRGELRRELHSLVGSGETFGLPEVTLAARAAEALLEGPGEPDWKALKARIEAIRRAAGTELAAKTSRRPGV